MLWNVNCYGSVVSLPFQWICRLMKTDAPPPAQGTYGTEEAIQWIRDNVRCGSWLVQLFGKVDMLFIRSLLLHAWCAHLTGRSFSNPLLYQAMVAQSTNWKLSLGAGWPRWLETWFCLVRILGHACTSGADVGMTIPHQPYSNLSTRVGTHVCPATCPHHDLILPCFSTHTCVRSGWAMSCSLMGARTRWGAAWCTNCRSAANGALGRARPAARCAQALDVRMRRQACAC